jgi:hypothetical protein
VRRIGHLLQQAALVLALFGLLLAELLAASPVIAQEPVPPSPAPDPAPDDGWPNDIPCGRIESLLFHFHARLAIYVDGVAQEIPYGIGIGEPWETVESSRGTFVTRGSCYSWLHTHTADGILHIEAPIPRVFTIGDFIAVWSAPLNAAQGARVEALAQALGEGPVFAYVNGGLVASDASGTASGTRDLWGVALADRDVSQLNVGTDWPPPQPVVFPSPCC